MSPTLLLARSTYAHRFFSYAETESDKIMRYFVALFYLIGLMLAPFYDTWTVAFGIGTLSVLAFYSAKIALPQSNLYQYVLAVVFGVFMAQYIYQMHGLFEMHFIAFIASALLITYQNWKLQIPLAIVVLIHHAVFGYMQFLGVGEIHFTQLAYMDLQTFIIHIGLATLVFVICGLWAYQFRKFSEKNIEQSFEIGRLEEERLKKSALLQLTENLRVSNEKLNAANHELNLLFNNISDVLFSVDMKKHQIVNISSACQTIYGYSAKEFYTAPQLWTEVIYKNDKHIIDDNYKQIEAGKAVKNQYRIIHRDGTLRWVENSVIPTLDKNNQLVRLDGITRDITEKKEAEAEIINLNTSLERKVHERTQQLEVAVKELEAFSYSVSHDLRAPLRVINGFSKIMQKRYTDKLGAEGMENLQVIMDNARQMGNLIDDLLDFSRLGRTPITKVSVDMNEMVKEVIDGATKAETNCKAQIKLGDLKAGLCDSALIKQVWVNLISNALKYSRKKEEPLIEIGTLDKNGECVYYVKDNGAGFDMEHIDKLFGVFQRLHKVAEYEGTGVGLALVQRIIERHGGKIWGVGKVDEGATFYFTLPETE